MKKYLLFLFSLIAVVPAISQTSCSDSVAVSICASVNNDGDTSTSKSVELFDSLRNTTSSISYHLENNYWKPQYGYLNSYTYDGFGHILTVLHQQVNGYSFPNNSSYETYIYDSPTHEREHAFYTWNAGNWKDSQRDSYYENALSDDTLIVHETGDTAGWHNNQRTFSFYNTDHLSVHDSLQSWNGIWWLQHETFTSYSGNNPDSVLQINYNSSGTITGKTYNLYIFDSTTMYMSYYNYSWDGTQWVGGIGDSALYDSSGHVILSYQGGIFAYAYDSLGNLVYSSYQGAGASSGYTGYYYINGVLRGSSGNYSTQGGFTSSSSCEHRYAEISGSEYTCGNTSVILSAQPCTSGNQYLWNTSETTSSIIATPPNSYSVTVTYPSGFIDSSFAFLLASSPSAQVHLGNDTTLCIAQNILLDASNIFEDYLWHDSSSYSTFLASDSISDTLYCSVLVVDSNGCFASDSVRIIFDVCAEISQLEKTFFTLSPNPTAGQFVISSKEFADKNSLIEIFNVMGEKIYSSPLTPEGGTMQISVKDLNTGIYFVRVGNDERQVTRKLVVE